MSNANGVSTFGIRVNTPFAGKIYAITMAAANYLENPVTVPLQVMLIDPTNPKFKIVHDEIVVAIVGVNHRSEDDSIIAMQAKVIKGSNQITSVPVINESNSVSDIPVLRDGDDLTMIVDTVYGDAVILKDSDSIGRNVVLDNLAGILCRLTLSMGFPVSHGDSIAWETFLADVDEYDGFQNEDEEDPNGGTGGDGTGGNGEPDNNGSGE